MKERILEVSRELELSHLGSNTSMADILDAVYSIKKPDERFVLSNGHAGLAQYVAMEKYEGKDAIELFHKHGVHPHKDKEDGIDVSTGSLGQGLPIALGMALADRSKRVYCTFSDGEAREGSIWEALRIGADNNVTNLKVILNANGWSAYDPVDATKLVDVFNATGWTIMEVDGHDVEEITQALEPDYEHPTLIVAHTNSDINDEIKGLDSHYKKL